MNNNQFPQQPQLNKTVTNENNHMFNSPNTPIVSLKNIQKAYKEGESKVEVLKDINLQLYSSEIIALVGASGSGKTTLLNVMGLLDTASAGELIINNILCSNLSDQKSSKVRRENIGFVFQFHHLLADFTALENITIPFILNNSNIKPAEVTEMGAEVLTKVGLLSKVKRYPSELSGGERQRVAIARALINSPSLLIADEPTGNLDPSLSHEICDLMIDLVKQKNGVAIIATHNLDIAKKLGKKATLSNGVLSLNNL